MGRTSNAPALLQDAFIQLVWAQSYSSVTVDAICETSGVKKGSFYYFYKSKAALALDSFERFWQTEGLAQYDALFSASKRPDQRLQDWLAYGYQKTAEQQMKTGRILGCPFFNIAQETSSIEPEIAAFIETILNRVVCYLTTALRDAQADGLTDIADPAASARAIFTLLQGSVTQARIKNSLAPVRELPLSVGRLAGLVLQEHPTPAVAA